MKKLVKVTLIIVVLVMGLAFGLSMSNNSQKDISLDFENSGQPEWYEVVELRASKRNFDSVQGFKNSGLPETIEVQSL
ncbi:hypothetical protein [Mariniplasma anaerobium]|uniref:Uncharacterized protein n=1 Tax=Mariniplasma anaerobium TaxID=2735436 RepID=A0A7U9XUR6_9MOLU|nr:hypothetical protein [Mariniplasma anaerobium]BCR35863.1 hypothetical protein MPAN_007560 [Mariniplasma anaerobium]